MNKYIDYYKILQVHFEANNKIIESAYKCLSKQYHPDVNPSDDAQERMKALNEAYSVLGDPVKRKEYDREWKKYNSGKPASSFMNGSDYKVDLAFAVIDDFFRDMVAENWEAAYHKLTPIDRKNVPLEDFTEWKVAVAKLHKLANYSVKYEKALANCEYAGTVFAEIMQFTVEMTIMEIATGQISREKTKKYVAYSDNAWQLCLGYSDLKPVISKFNYLSLLKAKTFQNERFPILNYYELLNEAKREHARSKRYGNPITLILITVKPKPSDMVVSEEAYLEKCMSYVSKELCAALRKTDVIGRYHESSFAVILTETPIENGKQVMGKLLQSAKRPKNLNYGLYAACTNCKSDAPMEDILRAALRKSAPDKIKNEIAYFL